MRKTRKVGRRVDLSSIMPLRVSNSETIENTHRGSARNEERARTVCTRATHSLNMQKVRASYGNKRFIEFARGSPDTGSCNCESYSLRTSLPFVSRQRFANCTSVQKTVLFGWWQNFRGELMESRWLFFLFESCSSLFSFFNGRTNTEAFVNYTDLFTIFFPI